MKILIPVIEPLLIYSSVGDWVHPKINQRTQDLEKMECGNLYGALIHITFLLENGTNIIIIALTNDEGVDKMMDEDDSIFEYIDILIMALNSDVWIPGEKPFAFTVYGEKFNFNHNLFNSHFSVSATPDVSLGYDTDDWWYDT